MCIINAIGEFAMGEQRQNARRSSKRPSLGKNEQKQVEAQDHHASPRPARPMTDDRATRIAYWQAQGQPWRTEPEIGTARQHELDECCARNIEKGKYPFKG